MKTKQMVLLALLLLGVGLTREAKAFFNSSSCRWLNRNTIEEEGGENLYGFVGNEAVSKKDALGLCTPGCDVECLCLPKPTFRQQDWNIAEDPGHEVLRGIPVRHWPSMV